MILKIECHEQDTENAEKLDFMGFHSYVNQNCIIDRMRSECYNNFCI